MKMIYWLLALLLFAALGWFAFSWKNTPPEIRFTIVKSEDLVDTLNTNGKAEPISWAAVRAERAGRLGEIRVQKGSIVTDGAIIALLENNEARIALQTAEARVTQVQGDLQTVKQGGSSSALAEIDANIARLRVEKTNLDQELAAIDRLIAKKAAPPQEAALPRGRLKVMVEQIRGLQDRRTALVSPGDQTAVDGRLKEAQAAVALAKEKMEQGSIRSPLEGVVFQVDLRPGAFVNPGDVVANVGRVDTMRVNVYVDEPELGRVAVGQPVNITWDALAGKSWVGTVERLPVQIVALGNRHVGEVLVSIANPGNELPPGANINAAVRSRTAPEAITIPKEAIRRENGVTGVFRLEGDKVTWRPIETGISNVSRIQVASGLKSGDRVALATDTPLRSGAVVKAASEDAGL